MARESRSHSFVGPALRACLAVLLAIQLALLPVPAAQAQVRSVSIVRDAEIEALVRDYAAPLLKAAGLAGSGIEIVLVNDRSFNAFVLGRRVFVNTGALLDARTPNQIIGVLAHEIGHIAGGHQQRLRQQLARAQTVAIVSMLLGIGAGVAGALGNVDGLGQAGMGAAAGGAEIARRGLLGYQRGEETTADRMALDYLNATGQSARGMLETFERFSRDLALSGSRIDRYQISHPMPRDRIANLETLARQSPHFDRADPPALQQRHDMARAKIAAYTEGRTAVARLFRDDPRGVAALYADALVTFLYGDIGQATRKIDALIAAAPGNPYFHEIKGEILMKANRPAEAAAAYSRALQLAPGSGLLRIGVGRALLTTGKPEEIRRGIAELKAGLDREPEYATGYRYLAQAYGQIGEVAEAELATAEGHFHSGNYQDARIFAARAQQKLQPGTPSWRKAQDIINLKQPGR